MQFHFLLHYTYCKMVTSTLILIIILVWLPTVPADFNVASRRVRSESLVDNTVRSCRMHIMIDHLLYLHFYTNIGQHDHQRTLNELHDLVKTHFDAVNRIFGDTSFEGINGIHFQVERVSVMTPKMCEEHQDVSPGVRASQQVPSVCESTVTAKDYLKLHSAPDHSWYCLAYAFTFRDFIGGQMGAAWTASSGLDTPRGICDRYRYFTIGGRRRRRMSRNTGVLTFLNYGTRVEDRVSQLLLAQQLGRSLGAQDDPVDVPHCRPGPPLGNYIMFPGATGADKPNNARFSVCSVTAIAKVLRNILKLPLTDPFATSALKTNCLIPRSTSFCGNGIVEADEECDCGFYERDCNEREGPGRCCFPRTTFETLGTNRVAACKLRPSKICSPTQGNCCSSVCQPYPSSTKCASETECQRSSYCTGTGATCPRANSKADGTSCRSNSAICRSGSCIGSVCDLIGFQDCLISASNSSAACDVSCVDPNDTDRVCRSSSDIPELSKYYQPGEGGIMKPPGSPCDSYRGYCDTNGNCKTVIRPIDYYQLAVWFKRTSLQIWNIIRKQLGVYPAGD